MHDRTLPLRPDLGQYRKQAKQLVKTAGSAEAQARIRRHHPRWSALSDPDPPPFKLADAQLVIAREHGFESWPKFAAHIEALAAGLQPVPAIAEAAPKPALLRIVLQQVELDAEAFGVAQARGLVLLAHASGSARYRPDTRQYAAGFNRAGFSTLSVDLLTDDEEVANGKLEFEIALLAARLIAVVDWMQAQPPFAALPVGCWACGAGAAAALHVAAERPRVVRAIVSNGGRADLAGSSLWKVQAPALLIVGGADSVGLGFNRLALSIFPKQVASAFKVIAGADPRFTTPAAREQATALACDWFQQHLLPREG
ncbi:MAG TPA: hypothetical protein VMH83_01790 [Candidatus Acidoferrum sp.]|nr:hypothetical protein [Candidatus Acidoferrum sp.]